MGRPDSPYTATRDRPGTLEELITDVCDFKRQAYDLIREQQKQIDILIHGMDAQESNYQHTNKRIKSPTIPDTIGRKAFNRVLMLENDFLRLQHSMRTK